MSYQIIHTLSPHTLKLIFLSLLYQSIHYPFFKLWFIIQMTFNNRQEVGTYVTTWKTIISYRTIKLTFLIRSYIRRFWITKMVEDTPVSHIALPHLSAFFFQHHLWFDSISIAKVTKAYAAVIWVLSDKNLTPTPRSLKNLLLFSWWQEHVSCHSGVVITSTRRTFLMTRETQNTGICQSLKHFVRHYPGR